MATGDTEVGVVFSADASGAVEGAATVRTSIQGINPDVKALAESMNALAATMQAGFAAMADASAKTREQIKADAEEEELSLAGIVGSAHEAALAIGEIKEMISGFGEAVMAFFAVEAIVEFAKQMGEAGEKTTHLSETLGVSVRDVQGLQAIATGAGFSIDTLAKGMEKLDRTFQNAADGNVKMTTALARIGISTSESYTQVELLTHAMEAFGKMEDGPQKVALAMTLFGKAGAALIPLLNQGAEGAARAREEFAKYGIENELAVERATQLAESQNETNVAMQGLGNVMAESLAPAFKSVVDSVNDMIAGFIKSYETGGLAKQVMEGLADAVKIAQSIFVVFGTVVATLMDVQRDLYNGLLTIATKVFTAIGDLLGLNAEYWRNLGDQLKQVIDNIINNELKPALEWIEKLAKATLDWLSKIPVVGPAIAATASTIKTAISDVVTHATDAQAALEKLWAATENKPSKPKGNGKTGGDESGKANTAAETNLQKAKEAFDAQQEAHKGMLTNEKADELAFWTDVAANYQQWGLTAKQASEIVIENNKRARDLDVQNTKDEIADAKQASLDKIAAANDVYKARVAELNDEAKSVADMAKKGEISNRDAHDIQIQLYDLERTAALTRDQAILNSRIALDAYIMAHAMANTTEYQAALRDEQAAQNAFNASEIAANDNKNKQISAADRALHDQQLAGWTQMTSGIVTTFGTGLRGMMQGTMSFQQVVLNIWNQILDQVFKVIEGIVEKWLVGLLMQQFGQQTTGGATAAIGVGQQAAVAGAAAFASTAAIPVTGPALAPAAGLAADGWVQGAFGAQALSGYAGGLSNVPYDGVAMIHTGETILPASIAQPMRAMIAANGNSMSTTGAAAAGGGGGGDTYQIAISAIDAKGVDTFMRGSGGDAIVKGLIAKRRQNAGASTS